jgi:hypothetical protein
MSKNVNRTRPSREPEWLAEYDGSDVTADIAVARALEQVGIAAEQWKLRDIVDPEALDRVFPHGSETGHDASVEFVVQGYRVVVEATGTVRVRHAD